MTGRRDQRGEQLEQISLAIHGRRLDDAAQLLAAAAATTTPPPPAPPRDEPTSSAFPTPAPLPDTPALRRARRAAAKAEAERDPDDEAAGRKAQAVVAMLATSARDVLGMRAGAAPVRPPTPKIAPYAALGRMLKARFRTDPDLAVDEVVAVIIGEVGRVRQPVLITSDKLTELVRRGRSGPYRTQDIMDEHSGRGLVAVPLGLTRWRPHDPTSLADEGLPHWMREDGADDGDETIG